MATFTAISTQVQLNCANKLTATEANTFTNNALAQAWDSFDWSFKKADLAVATVADYTTGTVTLTPGSATIVGSGTTWTSSMVNRWFRSGSGGDIYKITGFTDTTHLTIESPQGGTGYQASAAAAGASYVIFQHVYELSSDVFKVMLPTRLNPIEERTREEIDRIDPQRIQGSSQASIWAPRELSSNNNYQIELWPRINVNGIFRVPYLKVPQVLVNPTDVCLLRGDVVEHLATHKAAVYLLAKFGDERYAAIAQTMWRLYNGGKGDTEGGSLAQAMKQDMEKFGMVQHLGDSTRGPALSDDYLASHDVGYIGAGWY